MGVLLIKEVPFAHVVESDCASKVCSNCLKAPKANGDTVPRVSKCSRCSFAHYCNKKCQREDWDNHKWECKFLKRVAPRIVPPLPRLMSRIVMKLRSPEGNKRSYNGRTFASLMSHSENLQRTKAGDFCSVIFVLREYMGVEYPSSPSGYNDYLFDIFGKVIVNALEISDEDFTLVGHGLFIGLSALDHSCDSDAYVLFDGKTAVLRALKKNVTKYSDKLTIPYCDICLDKEFRQESLQGQFFFTCTCAFCNDPQGKEPSLRCTYCTDGYCPVIENPESFSALACVACNKERIVDTNGVTECYKALMEICELRNDKSGKDELTLPKAIEVFPKLEKYFSKYNIYMCLMAEYIRKLLTSEEKYELAAKYAEFTLIGFRTYYPPGHPILALRHYICGCLLECQMNPLALRRLEEAVELLKESHGSDHILTSQAAERLKALRQIH